MKHIKMLGLLAVAAAALMAFAGTAAASTLTGPSAGTVMKVGSTVEATAETTELHGAFPSVKCLHSIIKGEINQNATVATTTNAGGKVTTLHFSKCNYEVTTPAVGKLGTLEIDKSGNVYSTGTEISAHTTVGPCIFTTNNTKLGTLTGGTGAVLDINSVGIPRTGGNLFCGADGFLTGSYKVTNPGFLAVH